MAFSAGNESHIAKAGWLYRKSSILHRWKRNWFVLDKQGDLRYFEHPEAPRAEERIIVRVHVISITAAPYCKPHDPPEGLNRAMCGFLELKMHDKDKMVLCADSNDDMKAWQVALEEARTFHPPIPQQQVVYGHAPGLVQYVNAPSYYPGVYGGYPGQVIASPGMQSVVHAPGGTTTYITGAPVAQNLVVVDDDPYRYRRGRICYGGLSRGPLYWW